MAADWNNPGSTGTSFAPGQRMKSVVLAKPIADGPANGVRGRDRGSWLREYSQKASSGVGLKVHCGHAFGRRPGRRKPVGLRGAPGSGRKPSVDAARSVQDIENRDFLPAPRMPRDNPDPFIGAPADQRAGLLPRQRRAPSRRIGDHGARAD
jgi:hypothetical protein